MGEISVLANMEYPHAKPTVLAQFFSIVHGKSINICLIIAPKTSRNCFPQHQTVCVSEWDRMLGVTCMMVVPPPHHKMSLRQFWLRVARWNFAAFISRIALAQCVSKQMITADREVCHRSDRIDPVKKLAVPAFVMVSEFTAFLHLSSNGC